MILIEKVSRQKIDALLKRAEKNVKNRLKVFDDRRSYGTSHTYPYWKSDRPENEYIWRNVIL